MYAAATGITTVTATESDIEMLSPNASLTARDLAVQSASALPVAATVTVTLRDDAADTAVTCTIAALGTTCNSASASATIAAGSSLALEVTSTGVITGLSLLVGWQAA
jgi:hypothetical protein